MTDNSNPLHDDEPINEAILAEIEERVDAEVKRIKRVAGWVSGVLAIIGFGSISTLAYFWIDTTVDTMLEAKSDAFDIKAQVVFDTLEAYTLAQTVQGLELKEGGEERDIAKLMAYFRGVYDDQQRGDALDKSVRPVFETAVGHAVEVLGMNGWVTQTDALFAMFPDAALKDPDAVLALLHRYGREIVGRPYPARDDKALTAFEKLEPRAALVGYPEVSLLYRALYQTRLAPEGIPAESGTDILRHVSHLDSIDHYWFFADLFALSAPLPAFEQTPEDAAIARSGRRFYNDHRAFLMTLYPGLSLTPMPESGFSEAEAETLANAFAHHSVQEKTK